MKNFGILAGIALFFGAIPQMAQAVFSERVVLEEIDLGHRAGPALVKVDHKDRVWVALARQKALMSYDPISDTQKKYQLPESAFPVGILPARDGTVYFTDVGRNLLGRLDPDTGSIQEFLIPTTKAWPFSLAETADGVIWFTERFGNKIGTFDPKTQTIEEYELSTPNAQPAGLVATARGRLFFTQNAAQKIGTIDSKTKILMDFGVPSKLQDPPYYGLSGITADDQGILWFCELDGRIARAEWNEQLQSLTITEIPLPDPSSRPGGIFVDKSGLVWLTELDGNAIAYFKPDRSTFVRFPLLTGAADPKPLAPPEATARGQTPAERPAEAAKTSRPFGIFGSSDGSIWFSQQYGHRLGRLKPLPSESIQDNANIVRARWSRSVAFPGPQAPGDKSAIYLENGDELTWPAHVPYSVEIMAFFEDLNLPTKCNNLICSAGPLPTGTWKLPFADQKQLIVRPYQGAIKEFILPSSQRVPGVIEFTPVSGNYWFTEIGGFPLPRIGHLKPGEHIGMVDQGGGIREFKVPSAGASPTSIKVDPRGIVWFTQQSVGKIGRFDPRTEQFRDFLISSPGSGPTGIAIDNKRDRVWYTDKKLSRVGFVDQKTETMHDFATPHSNSEPSTVAVDGNGYVWFDQRAADNLVRFDPEGKVFKTYPLPMKNSRVIGVTPDPRQLGKIWFLELSGSALGLLDEKSGNVTRFPLPSKDSFPFKLYIDEGGLVWLTQVFGNRIAVFDGNYFLEFDVPTPGAMPGGITGNNAGTIRFSEQASDRIGEIITK